MMKGGAPPDPNMLLNLSFVGKFDCCGLAAECGGGPEVPRIAPPSEVPVEAAPFITLEELNDVVNKANFILESNFIPPCPVLCIPLAIFCYANAIGKMDSGLDELVVELNNQPGFQQRGCHW